jgi:hypothetical protein
LTIKSIADEMLNGTPAIRAMSQQPQFRGWAERLRILALEPDLALFRPVLTEIADEAFASFNPINRFETEASTRNLSIETVSRAAERIIKETESHPYPALALGIVVLIAWISRVGDQLYGLVNGVPHPGWEVVPYAAANASLATGGIEPAMSLTREAYEVFRSVRYPFWPSVRKSLDRYRELGSRIAWKHEVAIRNLADDLRASCCCKQPNFRAEVGAILWTLGLIPESRPFFRHSHDWQQPGQRFFRRVVRTSLQLIPRDSLLQFVWLELKDRPPFDLRYHRSLFHKINRVYGQERLDVMPFAPGTEPSLLYARPLIAWFRGNLDDDLARRFVEQSDLLGTSFPRVNWLFYLRTQLLAHLLRERFDWFVNESLPRSKADIWSHGLNLSGDLSRTGVSHPEWGELFTRASGPSFHLIESTLKEDSSASFGRGLEQLEEFRASALRFWLHISPPISSTLPHDVLEEERQLIQRLRGARFNLLYRSLPKHYKRYTGDRDLLAALGRDGDAHPLRQTAEELVRRFDLTEDELKEFLESLRNRDPAYVAKRLAPEATLDTFASALNEHRMGSPFSRPQSRG